jgi:small subunit ribosomal protein S3Ae
MAVGKNKRLSRGKKGQKKKAIDALARKDWYRMRAPNPFKSAPFGWTCISKSAGMRKAEEEIKGRVVECCQADLEDKSKFTWRKVKLVIDECEGRNVRTSFYGLDMTKDHNAQLISKWRTLIEAFADVKTIDGYILRVFVMGMTNCSHYKKTHKSYAKASQIKLIRKLMVDKVTRSVSSKNIVEVVSNMCSDELSGALKKACNKIFPLEYVEVRKVKIIQRPKIDAVKLNDMYREIKKVEKV